MIYHVIDPKLPLADVHAEDVEGSTCVHCTNNTYRIPPSSATTEASYKNNVREKEELHSSSLTTIMTRWAIIIVVNAQ